MDFWFGIVITIKQSIGICIFFASLICIFFDKDVLIKDKIIKIILRCFSVALVIGTMFIYIIKMNVLYEFIDYTILGIGLFKNNSWSYLEFLLYGNYFIVLVTLFFIIGFFYNIIMLVKTKDKGAFYIFIYGLATLSCMYPITDEYHILVGYIPNFILNLYFFNYYKQKEKINEIVIKKYIRIISVFLILLSSIFIVFLWFNILKNRYFNHYKYINIEKKMENELKSIEDFIETNPNTYIIDIIGLYYTVPLDRYNGILDLVNNGNLGKGGQQRLIQEIYKLNDCYFLIMPSNLSNLIRKQNPKKVVEYIENNFDYIQDVGRFQVYYKK